MLKRLLTSGLFLSTFFAASAQTATNIPTAAPRAVAAMPTATDTVQAIHRLFSKHRTGGWIWTGIGAAFAARIVTASATEGFDNASGTVVGTLVFGGLPAAIGIGKLSRFSQSTEDQVVAVYQKNKVLPNTVKRRLKKKYFSE